MLKAANAKRGMRVLLIGLLEQHARELETILAGHRARLIEADTTLAGWKRLHECVIDVVIVHDTAMGEGWRDLVGEIEAMGLTLPVVLASERPDDRLWIDALCAGAYDVLEIPFHPGETMRVLLAAQQTKATPSASSRCNSRLSGPRGASMVTRPAGAMLPA